MKIDGSNKKSLTHNNGDDYLTAIGWPIKWEPPG